MMLWTAVIWLPVTRAFSGLKPAPLYGADDWPTNPAQAARGTSPVAFEPPMMLWEDVPDYEEKTFAGVTPNDVAQYFSPRMLEKLVGRYDASGAPTTALANAQRWQVDGRVFWCGNEANPDQEPLPTSMGGAVALVPDTVGMSKEMSYACSTPEATAYFQQGLTQRYAFNDNEAICSFMSASAIDSNCPLAYLGVALSAGPNVNYAEIPNGPTYALIIASLENAKASMDSVVGIEKTVSQDLLGAFEERYLPKKEGGIRYTLEEAAATPPMEMLGLWLTQKVELNAAYEQAMFAAHETFPDDTAIAALTVGALMQNPAWKWWQPGSEYANFTGYPDGMIRSVSERICATPACNSAKANRILIKILGTDPNHLAGNHYYIHNMEAGPTPGWVLAVANRIQATEPSGHVQHMSSHIFTRTGFYDTSLEWNKRANQADLKWYDDRAGGAFLTQTYRYMDHDIQFQIEAAMHGGNFKEMAAAISLLMQHAGFRTSATRGANGNDVTRLQSMYTFPLRFPIEKAFYAALRAKQGPIEIELATTKPPRYQYGPGAEETMAVPEFLNSMALHAYAVSASRSARSWDTVADVAMYQSTYGSEETPVPMLDALQAIQDLNGIIKNKYQDLECYTDPCGDATAACANAICDFLLDKWEKDKDSTLNANSSDATGTTTINNADAQNCMAVLTSQAEYELARGDVDRALELFERAHDTQVILQYDEPSPWYYPVGESVGGILLAKGDYAKAAETFRQVLFTWPRTIRSVLGLHEALAGSSSDYYPDSTMLSLATKYNDTANLTPLMGPPLGDLATATTA